MIGYTPGSPNFSPSTPPYPSPSTPSYAPDPPSFNTAASPSYTMPGNMPSIHHFTLAQTATNVTRTDVKSDNIKTLGSGNMNMKRYAEEDEDEDSDTDNAIHFSGVSGNEASISIAPVMAPPTPLSAVAVRSSNSPIGVLLTREQQLRPQGSVVSDAFQYCKCHKFCFSLQCLPISLASRFPELI